MKSVALAAAKDGRLVWEEAFGWSLTEEDLAEVDAILNEAVTDPVGPEFMAPPARK